jgi:N-methylhydantoinase B
MAVDPLTLAFITNALGSTAEQMGWVLQTTSFSEAVREGADCSATVFDANGNLIGQGAYAPGHIGTSATAVAAIVERFPRETMKPGDAFLVNDPSMNSGHLPDMFSIAPVFHDGDRLIGFTVVTAHHVDVGGAAPGSQAIVGIFDIHQEGIRILPVRHFVEGEPNTDVLDLIGGNVRVPDQVIGDIKGQYNANMVGAAKLREIVERFGPETFEEAVAELLDKSEAAMRAAITEIPDGSYEFVNYLDDCGPGTEPLRAQLKITIDGDEITSDYAGSSPAVRAGLNAYVAFTRAYTVHTLKSIIGPRLPQNSGTTRPLHIQAPDGSMLSAVYPTPSGGRALMVRLIVDVVMGAMAQATPDQVQAASSQLCNCTIGGVDERTGKPFVYYDLTFGSTGARATADGCEGLTSGFNTANVPVEVHETVWPIRVNRFAFIQDSGGAGKFRGGLAVERDVENLANTSRLTNLHDRHVFGPWGLEGGSPGKLGRIVLNPGDSEEELHSKSIVDFERGSVVSFQTCGGGGRGDPFERDPWRVLVDVLEGWVSPEAAREQYGVVLSDDDEPRVLEEETAALRRQGAENRTAVA